MKTRKLIILTLIPLHLIFLSGTLNKGYSQVFDPNKQDNKTLTETEKYINTYKFLAIKEMQRARVPASITIAQGILESSVGNSYIAKMGNNHFGIKCGSNWTGQAVYYDDDQENECFRSYKSVDESFVDHSDFLAKSPRYAELFKLEITDYKGWATGLKAAGYATRSNYADLLIGLIERYQLAEYDKFQTKQKTNEPVDQFVYNGLPAVMIREGQTFQMIADQFNVKVEKLLKYNDLTPTDKPVPNMILYLKSKKSKGKDSYHIVKAGETMYLISQEYGVKLKNLLQNNLMLPGDLPAIGELIYLNKKRIDPPSLRQPDDLEEETKPVTKPPQTQVQDSVQENKDIFADDTVQPEPEDTTANDTAYTPYPPNDFVYTPSKPATNPPADQTTTVTPAQTPVANKPVTTPPASNVTVVNTPTQPPVANPPTTFHVVEKGQTMFSISKMYLMTVAELQQYNNKTDNSLTIGEKLLVKKIASAPTVTNVVTPAPATPPPTVTKPAPTPPPVNIPSDATYHIVVKGETMFSISKKYNLTVTELQQLNNKTDNSLSLGEKLLVSNKKKQPNITIVDQSSGKTINPPVTKPPVSKPPVTTPPKAATPPPAAPVQNVVYNKPVDTNKTKDTTYHVVKDGESFYSISRDYKVKISDIIAWNNITEYKLTAGQKIVVGAPAPRFNPYLNQKQPTEQDYHFVEQGETMFSIAKKYNTTMDNIKALNGMKDNNIKVAQKLRIR